MDILKASSVSKRFGKKSVLSDFSVSLSEGETLLIIGFNGVGKSTLLDILNGVCFPDEGLIEMPDRKEIGYMASASEIYEDLTGYKYLRFHTDFYEIPKKRANEIIDEITDSMGVSDLKDKRFATMSSGERKRMKFIASIVHSPKLLILDEPFSNLDIKQCVVMTKMLSKLKKNGTTIVIVSHEFGTLEEIYDKILVMHGSDRHIVIGKDELERSQKSLITVVKEYIN